MGPLQTIQLVVSFSIWSFSTYSRKYQSRLRLLRQDLSSYTLTFENGRMKVDAKRMLTTGDATDYELSLDKTYYILLVVPGLHGVKIGMSGCVKVGTFCQNRVEYVCVVVAN